jgi:hypothetical protein
MFVNEIDPPPRPVWAEDPPAAAVPEAPACQVRWDSRRLAWVCSHMASAVPEAQDGRERENRWNDALNEANRRYGGHRRVVAPLLALADAEIAASAAVREGERERRQCPVKGCGGHDPMAFRWAIEAHGPGAPDAFFCSPDCLAASLAAPSLAAPEQKDQP